ncbi:putative 8-amino-7-oxononanoate synthase [Erysiphe neolycopersici]|uniref:Putative 8-amino-7-oxononanoate synthase n=1 Tax=Erysiphe neolycopersici TaxID=212602 RepID=A0A420HJN9_9PEZI|nr:putative 8-amino-7-oxononanoate synthase [Erysiphe neolycopersici]
MASSVLAQSMRMALENRRHNSTLRSIQDIPSTSIDFSSNDFLSLSKSHLIRHEYLSALYRTKSEDFRLGSGGSRLLDGNLPLASQLELMLAEFHEAPSALLFNSGFDANTSIFACIPQKGDVIIYDAYIHASVHEGMKLSRATTMCSFEHNSLSHLRNLIFNLNKAEPGLMDGTKSIFVAIEALYSMDGDTAPLREIVELIEELFPNGNGYLIVDEAHSNGIYGQNGRGLVHSLGLQSRIFARLHTFGKALACNGAAILCDNLVREYLINYAKPFIYTTSMSYPSLVAVKTVYTAMNQGTTQPFILHLETLIGYLFNQLNLLLSPFTTHPKSMETLLIIPLKTPLSPIFPLITPDPRGLATHCQAAGYLVRAIMPPTVPLGTQRVRICLHAGNTFKEVDNLVHCILLWLKKERRKEPSAQMSCKRPLIKAVL